MDALTALLHEDATQSMPPYELWLRGRDDILRCGSGPGAGCRGSRLVPTVARTARRRSASTGRAAGRRLRAVGAAGARECGTGGSSSSASSSTPPRCSRCSGSRPCWSPTRTETEHVAQPEQRDQLPQRGGGPAQPNAAPSRRAASGSRASASTVTASGRHTAATSQTSSRAPRPRRAARPRAHSPGRSAGASGPPIASTVVRGSGGVRLVHCSKRPGSGPKLIGHR